MASMETPMQNILDESIEEANRSLESQELLNQAQDIVVENEQVDKAIVTITRVTWLAGVLTNKTEGSLSVMAHYPYAGYTVKNYPNPLNLAGPFAMVGGLFGKGVTSAVVYSGKNKLGIECGWLLAFADTKDTGRKIYGECGPKDKFANVNWEEVKKNLINLGRAIANAKDEATGTSLHATILGSGGKSAVAGIFLG